MTAAEFEDGIAVVNLMPGPASTQLAIFSAWRLRRMAGALVGGACFIVPGLIVILGLSAVFLSGRPPWPLAVVTSSVVEGLGAVAWVAFKVGALSYGGRVNILPAAHRDARSRHDIARCVLVVWLLRSAVIVSRSRWLTSTVRNPIERSSSERCSRGPNRP